MNTITKIKEVRFNFEDDDLTQCYVIVDAWNDVPLGVIGCHHKTFPAKMSAVDILNSDDFSDYLLWPLNAPPQ